MCQGRTADTTAPGRRSQTIKTINNYLPVTELCLFYISSLLETEALTFCGAAKGKFHKKRAAGKSRCPSFSRPTATVSSPRRRVLENEKNRKVGRQTSDSSHEKTQSWKFFPLPDFHSFLQFFSFAGMKNKLSNEFYYLLTLLGLPRVINSSIKDVFLLQSWGPE